MPQSKEHDFKACRCGLMYTDEEIVEMWTAKEGGPRMGVWMVGTEVTVMTFGGDDAVQGRGRAKEETAGEAQG